MARTLKIGKVELKSGLTLAPMAGVTDFAFRRICRSFGCAYTVTEMVSAKALTMGDKKSQALLYSREEDRPFAAQIFGCDPAVMARGAAIAAELSGAQVIDINMGCPVGKIVKNGEGAALMRSPELAGEIVAAVAGAVSVPVTVKLRKGYDSASVNAVEIAKICSDAGASAITVHGRIRVAQYSGTADMQIIRAVVSAVSVPVFANGDIFSGDDAKRSLAQTGAAGIAVGRGAMGSPWIFSEIEAVLDERDAPPRPTLAEIADIAYEQIALSASIKGERTACFEARGCLSRYVSGIRNASFWRRLAVKVETLDDVRFITNDMRLNSERNSRNGRNCENS